MAENKITSSDINEVPKNDTGMPEQKKHNEKVVVETEKAVVGQKVPQKPKDTSKVATGEKKDSKKVKEQDPKQNISQPESMSVEAQKRVETVVVKKGGTGIALLALLVALGLGGAGYYFGLQQVDQIHQKLTALEYKAGQAMVAPSIDIPSFDQERQQIAQLVEANRMVDEKLLLLQKELAVKEHVISSLQNQVNRLSSASKPQQPNDWLLSEADFLLNNALRKLVLDNDVETSISLLKVADEALEKVSDPRVVSVRTAINQDLKQLLAVNNVDQNAIMQRLSQLANNLDELTVLDVNFDEVDSANQKLTDSLDDWKENAEKSATSFLNHFIRITPRNSHDKALLAPNQDIYLRENIRLRLQIAIMAVPRQQDDLYKQSLETVASWVRSYFDTSSELAQSFLKSVDELAEQSIYIDVPNQLSSLNVLDKLLNKQSQEVQKIEISVDKALTEQPAGDTPKNDDNTSTTEQQ
ncbi:uroporphyrinogen-III C-methyltransferase [Pasteurella oralis]|uniref:uroporphyrinogen-III C-methyltransferase n=1 Tax=Pasteurella oralis TaxID=1071947 RepID=UPI000C7B604D|nr:uroporphyrinogen-III C-methyltransferase [Pasteurella oralis]